MRFRAKRIALQGLVCAATAAAAGAGGVLLLRRRKHQQIPVVKRYLNIPEIYGDPIRPISAEALAKEVAASSQQQFQTLMKMGVSSAAAAAAADAAAAAIAAQIPSSTWADELAAKNLSLGTPAKLLAAAKAGAPLELHVHLKTLFCASLRMAILGDLAAAQQQQNKGQQQQEQRHEQAQAMQEADLRWVLQKTECLFRDIFYEPQIRAAASAVDFALPARELLLELQQIRSSSSRSSSESLLPLLLIRQGTEACERFIAAVGMQILNSLSSSWASSGVLQQRQQQPEADPPARVRQLSALNTGKNVCTPMALASYADATDRCQGGHHGEPQGSRLFLRAAETEAAVRALAKQGFVIVKDALTADQLQQIQQATFSACGSAAEGGTKMKEVDPNIYCTRPTYGRLHCLLRGSLVEDSLLEIQRLFMPLLHTYLPSGTPPEAGDSQPKTRLFVSDMQTVNADALALTQPWHRDSSYRGLTILIPLVPIHSSNGPTELLPGSHTLCGQAGADSWFGWARSLPSFMRNLLAGGATVKPELLPGDVLIYDSRLLHRGQANETWHPRPTLVLRYDYEETPPPGVYTNILRSLGASMFGQVVGGFMDFYEKL